MHPVNTLLAMAISIGMLFPALATCAQTARVSPSATPQAQTPAPRHAIHPKKRRKGAHAPAPVPPPPPPPLPPVQQAATPAKIDFSHGSLSVDAKNSSLTQILDQISHRTGIEIQGLDQDERIYGQYGPDTVANTLTDLLDGAGYNYVMIGGGNGSPPTKLVLTRNTGGPTGGGAAGANPTSGNPAGGNPTGGNPAIGNPANGAAPGSFAPPNGGVGGSSGPNIGDPDPSVQPGMPEDQPPDDSTSGQPKTPQEVFDQLRQLHPQ